MGKKSRNNIRGIIPRSEKRVAIVGTGEGYHLAPKSGTVWAIGNLGCNIYSSMIWDMHNFNWSYEECIESYRHFKETGHADEYIMERINKRKMRWDEIRLYCKQYNIPLMSVVKYDDIPSSIEFPLKDIIKRFDTYFFSSCVAYMLAYAIYTNHTHLDLYGIVVGKGTEWEFQRDCVTYWIGYARGKGIKVTISGSAARPTRLYPVLECKLYSYDISQPQIGIQRIENVLHLGKKYRIVTTWDEGPQHKDSPPIKSEFEISMNDILNSMKQGS